MHSINHWFRRFYLCQNTVRVWYLFDYNLGWILTIYNLLSKISTIQDMVHFQFHVQLQVFGIFFRPPVTPVTTPINCDLSDASFTCQSFWLLSVSNVIWQVPVTLWRSWSDVCHIRNFHTHAGCSVIDTLLLITELYWELFLCIVWIEEIFLLYKLFTEWKSVNFWRKYCNYGA